jgi:hypothetical protein
MVPSVASEKKSPATPLGVDPETLQLVAQCLNHYATPGPINNHILDLFMLCLTALSHLRASNGRIISEQ